MRRTLMDLLKERTLERQINSNLKDFALQVDDSYSAIYIRVHKLTLGIEWMAVAFHNNSYSSQYFGRP